MDSSLDKRYIVTRPQKRIRMGHLKKCFISALPKKENREILYTYLTNFWKYLAILDTDLNQ